MVPKLHLLLGRLRSIRLALHGSIVYFFYIQEALTKAETGIKAFFLRHFIERDLIGSNSTMTLLSGHAS